MTKLYPNIQFVFYKLEKNTDGAAETILIGLNYLESINIADNPDRFVEAATLDIGLNLGLSYFISEQFYI